MHLLKFLLAFTFFTFAYAIPQSPVGSSGGGDSGSSDSGSGDAVGSAAASSRATSRNLSSRLPTTLKKPLLIFPMFDQSQPPYPAQAP